MVDLLPLQLGYRNPGRREVPWKKPWVGSESWESRCYPGQPSVPQEVKATYMYISKNASKTNTPSPSSKSSLINGRISSTTHSTSLSLPPELALFPPVGVLGVIGLVGELALDIVLDKPIKDFVGEGEGISALCPLCPFTNFAFATCKN
jgi:hypothetical protein